jgi:hypothetical protein
LTVAEPGRQVGGQHSTPADLGVGLRNAYAAFSGESAAPAVQVVALEVAVGLILAFTLAVLHLWAGSR